MSVTVWLLKLAINIIPNNYIIIINHFYYFIIILNIILFNLVNNYVHFLIMLLELLMKYHSSIYFTKARILSQCKRETYDLKKQ